MCGGASSIFQASWSALISLQYLGLSHLLSPTLLTKVSCRLIGTFIRGQPLSSSFLGSRNIFPRNPHFSSCAQDAPEIRTHLLLLVGSFSLPLVRLIKIIHNEPFSSKASQRHTPHRPIGTYDMDVDGRGAPTKAMFTLVFGFLHDQLRNSV